MSWQTIEARSCLVPQFGRVLHLASVKFADAPSPDASINECDRALAHAAGSLVGAPARHFLTFSRWETIRQRISNSIADERYVRDMRASIAGDDAESVERFHHDLETMKSILGHLGSRVPDVQTFAACALRNIILNPTGSESSNLGILLGAPGYQRGGSIAQSIYADLSQFGEIALKEWAVVSSAALNERIRPTAKEAFEEFLGLGIPFAGSDPIKALTVAEAVKYCRGMGILILGEAAIGSAAMVGSGHVIAAFYVSGGGIANAILFIGFGAILPELEASFRRGAKRLSGSLQGEPSETPSGTA